MLGIGESRCYGFIRAVHIERHHVMPAVRVVCSVPSRNLNLAEPSINPLGRT